MGWILYGVVAVFQAPVGPWAPVPVFSEAACTSGCTSQQMVCFEVNSGRAEFGGNTKVLDFELDYPGSLEWGGSRPTVDLTRCTRCGQPWGFELIERVEMWNCDYCGYEAREKSSDYWRMLVAEQEALIS